MATFEEALVAIRRGGCEFEINNWFINKFDGPYNYTFKLDAHNRITSQNDYDIFSLFNSKELFLMDDIKIVSKFKPRQYEFKAYLGENEQNKLEERETLYSLHKKLGHYCSPFKEKLQDVDVRYKKSKWKITMEELEMKDDE